MGKSSTIIYHDLDIKKKFLQRIPIAQWIPEYTKFNFISDIIGGITVGLMMIPQSIAYAGTAALPAQYGLYTAFIGSFTYVIFGTIKQVSIGPTSLLSMLTFNYLEGYSIEYVILLTFVAGCVELTMGLLNLGFLVDFISPAVSGAFTSSISISIMVSQLKSLFGLKINKTHSFLELVWMILKNLKKIQIGDTILGVCSIVFLLFFKQIPKIKVKNPMYQKCFWLLSISRNALIVMITSSIAFYYVHTERKVPFALSSKVPSGLPQFSIPKFSVVQNNETLSFFDMWHSLGSGVFVVPICAILTNVAIAKSFARELIVDASQEMITLGLCNIFGSFIQAMPSSGAFSRSAVANASGVKTPMQGLYSGIIIILALSFLTPYFHYIPKATLAAVLITAVSTMIEYDILPKLWKTNKFDFVLAVSTCSVGVIFGSDIGIIIGAIANLIILLKEWSRPKISIKIRKSGRMNNHILVQPELGLCYPARDYLTKKVKEAHNSHPTLPIIIDCKKILKIDYAGAEALKNLVELYNDNSRLILTNLNPESLKILKKLTNSEKFMYSQNNFTFEDEIFGNQKHSETMIPLLMH